MARLLLMTDFSESYANKLLKGIVRFSHEHEPWVVCKMPLSLRDNGRMEEVLKFAIDWKADAIIGQFLPTDDVDAFSRHGEDTGNRHKKSIGCNKKYDCKGISL